MPNRMKGGYAALDVMENHLAKRDFFVDGRFGLADIALYAYTHVAHEGGFDLSKHKSVNAWMARVAGQPRHVTIANDKQPNQGERPMPMINVQLFEGRTLEQRRKLARELTDGTCRALGCTPDAVQIILTDHQKGELGRGREAVLGLMTCN